jgi:uncharacterized membrane protein YbhN (UPF0104 family)
MAHQWAMLHAFGSPPVLPVIALAYFIGQVANMLPIPGSVSGGMTGVLVAFGVPVELAIPPVLAYRAVAIWLPSPVAIGAVPALRATVRARGTRGRHRDLTRLTDKPAAPPVVAVDHGLDRAWLHLS